MNGTLALSPRRITRLMAHDLASQRKSLRSGFGTLAGIVFAFFLIASATGNTGEFHSSFYLNILLIGGYVVSSVAFSELQDAKTGAHYLMLPGSTLEKYLSKLLLTALGWTVASTVVYILATVLGTLVGGLFFDSTPGVFLPTSSTVWNGIAGYLVTQQIFLFGSVYFRKVAFLKTGLAAILTGIALGVVFMIAFRILFAPAFTGFLQMSGNELGAQLSTTESTAFLQGVEVLGDVLFWAVSPIFFWILGILRLRETEV